MFEAGRAKASRASCSNCEAVIKLRSHGADRAEPTAQVRGSAVNACCYRAITPATLLRHTDVPTGMSAHSVCRSTDAPGEVLADVRGYPLRVAVARVSVWRRD